MNGRTNRFRIHSRRALMVVVIGILPQLSAAQGVVKDWIGPNGGSWLTAGNWDPSGPPAGNDIVRIANGEPDATNTAVFVGGDGRILIRSSSDVTMGTLRMSGGDGWLDVFEASRLVNDNTEIGLIWGSSSIATVSGAGSAWDMTDPSPGTSDLDVGEFGDGTLNVLDGGTFLGAEEATLGTEGTGRGTVNVNGPNSTFDVEILEIGRSGTGDLDVAAGAVFAQQTNFGVNTSGVGAATIASGASWTNTGAMNVGVAGHGQLQIRSGSSVNVSSAASVGQSVGGRGDVTIDGVGSQWDIGGKLTAADAGTAVVNVRNGASLESTGADVARQTGARGTINVDGLGSSWNDNGASIIGLGNNGDGLLNITAGGLVTSSQAVVGLNSGADGHVVVDGPGSTWNLTTNTLQVGSGGAGIVDVANGGKIIASGNVIIANGSSAAGDVTVDGFGSLLTVGADLFVGNSGAGTLTIDNGGQVTVAQETSIGAGDTLTLNDGLLSTTDFTRNGAFNFNGGTFEIRGGDAAFNSSLAFSGSAETPTVFRALDGADVILTVSFQVGNAADEFATAVVSGTSGDGLRRSTVRGTSGGAGADHIVGGSGTGHLTVANGALVDMRDDFILGDSATGEGIVVVSGVNGAFRSTVEANNGGSGSIVQVGRLGSGDLTIADGGLVITTGQVTIGQTAGSTGKLTIGGRAGGFDATFDTSSSVSIGGTTGSAGGTGELTVNAGGLLEAGGTIRVWDTGTLTLDGGAITALGSAFVVESGAAFDWRRGTLTLSLANSATFADGLTVPDDGTLDTDADVTGPITSQPGSTILINGNVALGDSTSFVGVNLHGVTNVRDNSLTLNSAGFAGLGSLTTLDNGTLMAANGVALGAGDVLDGHGIVAAKIAASVGSVIRESAGGSFTLGDANAFDGFHSDGTLITLAGGLTLLDKNQATLGALTHLDGDAMLTAANGIVVDFGRAITGFGTVDTPDDPTRPTIINGNAEGESAASPLFFQGHVKGVGTFADVVFNGTFSPGLSPAAIDVGNLAFGEQAELVIELGGLAPGSGYDQINSDSSIGLNGSLVVELISGFVPNLGDSFTVLTATSTLTGEFSEIDFPELAPGLQWRIDQQATSLLLAIGLAGDYNADGVVDAADYTVWRDEAGQFGAPLAADGDADGDVDQLDYLVWRNNFGATAAASLQIAVPEPTAWCLLLGSLITIGPRGLVSRPTPS